MKKILAFTLSLFILFTLGSFVVYAQTCPDGSPAPGGNINNCPVGGSDSVNPNGNDAVRLRLEYTPQEPITLVNPFSHGDTIQELFRTIATNILIPIGGVLAVLAFIYSGFLYVTAQGNESKLETAHKALLYTAIGTAILLGAAVIASVIGNTVNQLQT